VERKAQLGYRGIPEQFLYESAIAYKEAHACVTVEVDGLM